MSKQETKNIQSIIDGKPDGASGYAEHEGKIFYFIKSSYGWRQIKGNTIQFDDAGLDLDIKPL